MISRGTISEITRIIDQWCEVMDVDQDDLVVLIQKLAEVPANKSYKDSIRALLIALKDGGA